MTLDDAAIALTALGHSSRLMVFKTLVQAGPGGLAAGRIASLTGIAPSLLSFHLKELAHAGLAIARPLGRYMIYAADFAAMNRLLAYLGENCCNGNPCLAIAEPACAQAGLPDPRQADPE